jgi:hypothetical protein
LLQYYDALGLDVPDMKPSGNHQRWLWFGADFKAMMAYRKNGELTIWKWLKSYFTTPGKVEFHVFSWDDPMPLFASWAINLRKNVLRVFSFLKKTAGRLITLSRANLFHY